MTYNVVTYKNIGNAPEVILATTRRYNGAVAEQDRYIESYVAVNRKHHPNARIVVGPTDNANITAIVTMLDTHDMIDYIEVREVNVQRRKATCNVKNCRLDDKGHARAVEHIMRNIGPRAADDYAWKHRSNEEDE